MTTNTSTLEGPSRATASTLPPPVIPAPDTDFPDEGRPKPLQPEPDPPAPAPAPSQDPEPQPEQDRH